MFFNARLALTAATFALAAPSLAGGFWLQLGNPEASDEARAKHAGLIVKAAGCPDPATIQVSGRAIRIVNGARDCGLCAGKSLPGNETTPGPNRRKNIMSEDYLWDRSGEPDPEIAKLETLLSTFRHERKPPPSAPKRNFRWLAVAAIASIAIAIGFVFQATRGPGAKTAWQAVKMVDGREAAEPIALRANQRIRTDSQTRMQVRSESRDQHQLLSLRKGTLHALISAPPSQFAVDTPAARAIDLGCAYTLQTDANGNGTLPVERGWVAFDREHTESFIPTAASCRIYAKRGLGIPFFQDAPPGFRDALQHFETARDPSALRNLLTSARARDALTLWHLLSRVTAADRGLVFDRFAALVVIPREVKRNAVIAGDPRSLELCWDALQLGETAWWRTWKQTW